MYSRDLSILELVETSNTSVRLNNCIVAASSTGTLPFETVGQYIDAGDSAALVMKRAVRNFGKKTARELDKLIEDAAEDKLVLHPSATKESILKERLLSIFANESVKQVIVGEVFSARLEAALKSDDVCSLTMREFIDSFDRSLAQMRHKGNFGAASAEELREFILEYVSRRLAAHGCEDTLVLSNWLIGSTPPGLQDALGQFDGTSEDFEPALPNAQGDIAFEHGSLVERLEWLLDELEPRSKMILHRRNGIGQQLPETLEEIGATEGVTRERIRQIEAKALKRIRKRIVRFPIIDLLQQNGATIFSTLSEGKFWLTNDQLVERRRHIEPYTRLALQIIDMKLENWIEAIAVPEEFGWLSKQADLAKFGRVTATLRDLSSAPLPQAIVGLVSEDEKDFVEAVAYLVLNKQVYLGYLLPGRVGARLRRLVRLHAILASVKFGLVEELIESYHTHFPDDPCTVRDAEIVMQAAPHLFLEVEDGFWTAIGEAGSAHIDANETDALAPAAPEVDSGTIAYALEAHLKKNGPTRLVDLMDNASLILPEGRSVNSIGPILLTRRDLFVRLLPGVYGLPSHVSCFRAELPEGWPVLLNEFQARAYAIARYAGEPRSIFPLWTPMAEQAICAWARHSGTAEVFASLLHIAEVDEWSTSISETLAWSRLSETKAQYCLGTELRHQAAFVMPTLDRLFAACFHAWHTGSFNWIAANRLIGRKLDSHTGAGLVALLLRLGAIEETKKTGYRWQRPHHATPVARQLYSRLDETFRINGGETGWDSRLGAELRDQARSIEADDWVDNSSFHSMLASYRDQEPVDDAVDDPLEQVLYEQAKIRSLERKEATLDWLLEE